MSDSIGSLMRRAAIAACLTLGGLTPAFAQAPAADTPPEGVQFMPRYDFSMSAAALGNDDQRFSWDTHWAGDLDVVDYGHGRLTFLADYQALLGSEFRAFDPYQSNYLLEGSGSFRAHGVEIAAVLNHVSRHFGDRFKRVAVAENSLGLRVMHTAGHRKTTLKMQVDLRKVIARAYVDYTWIGDLDVTLRRSLSARTSAYGRVYGQGDAVDETIAGRHHQYGGRAEVGVQVAGTGGAVDLFVGAERMIDADPLDRIPRRWAFVGFRLVGH
jgi:hypothetical protein